MVTCISDLYYRIGLWFTVIMVAIAFGTLPFALDRWDSVFSFVICGAIAFVGVAGHYRDKFEGKIHYVAACLSAVCSVVWTWHVCPMWVTVLVVAFVFAYTDRVRWLLWGEVGCFVMFYASLLSQS